MNIIEAKNLTFSYTDKPLLADLTFSIPSGSFVAIAGPNGVGKTTLLNLLSASLKAQSGSMTIDGKDIRSFSAAMLARKIAVVRQEFIPPFGFSVIQTVLMARTPYYNRLGFETPADREIAANALKATDIADLAGRQLAQISGGERQRVFIARALAQKTPILLLDEPTSFLDLRHQVKIYDLLKKMQIEEKKTVIAITHDINLASQYCDNVLLLAQDARYYQGTPNDVFSTETIGKVYGIGGFSGPVRTQKFFLPLGQYARDYRPT